MNRRGYLRSLSATGIAVTAAGCLGSFGGDSHPNVTMSKPDVNYDVSKLPYPAWNQQIPDLTIPAPLEDQKISLRDVNKPSLITFIYTHCKTICPVLVSTLRNVQTHAQQNGYASDVSFLPISFDPRRDDAQRLKKYSKQMNIDQSIDDWHFLRPQSEKRARTIVTDDFGVHFEKNHKKSKDNYMFTHSALVLLANEKGYVERSYRGQNPPQKQIIDDLEKVRG
ncbi:SCO family protein [Haladaptatus sp.]|uniref:SCO family protein n=1 Tax=Haladaptatus sp. TaxID=1973141 RepID=UPI003C63067D